MCRRRARIAFIAVVLGKLWVCCLNGLLLPARETATFRSGIVSFCHGFSPTSIAPAKPAQWAVADDVRVHRRAGDRDRARRAVLMRGSGIERLLGEATIVTVDDRHAVAIRDDASRIALPTH